MRLHQLLERHVMEAEIVGVDNDLTRGVNASRHHDADALEHRFRRLRRRQDLADRLRQLVRHALRPVMREPDGAPLHDLERIVH